jgi:hypothetical protein
VTDYDRNMTSTILDALHHGLGDEFGVTYGDALRQLELADDEIGRLRQLADEADQRAVRIADSVFMNNDDLLRRLEELTQESARMDYVITRVRWVAETLAGDDIRPDLIDSLNARPPGLLSPPPACEMLQKAKAELAVARETIGRVEAWMESIRRDVYIESSGWELVAELREVMNGPADSESPVQ